mgnify:CR=1 FL=1
MSGSGDGYGQCQWRYGHKSSCQEAVLRDNASGDLSADNLKAVKVNAAVYGSGDLSCRALVPLRRKRMAAEVLAIPVTPLR